MAPFGVALIQDQTLTAKLQAAVRFSEVQRGNLNDMTENQANPGDEGRPENPETAAQTPAVNPSTPRGTPPVPAVPGATPPPAGLGATSPAGWDAPRPPGTPQPPPPATAFDPTLDWSRPGHPGQPPASPAAPTGAAAQYGAIAQPRQGQPGQAQPGQGQPGQPGYPSALAPHIGAHPAAT